ncbi:MAG: hypothetical protein JRN21_08710 [Nitrososphaerota archaeon]|nr:hypothetical protein [Nitrososphaerota archaeon]
MEGDEPRAANSLYESLMIYIALQNATIRRAAQMLENLFFSFGQRMSFDGRTHSVFWPPGTVAKSKVDELRLLKVGCRAKSVTKISEQFADGAVDEVALRGYPGQAVAKELDKLYGIGLTTGNPVRELLFLRCARACPSLGEEDHVAPAVR